MRYLHRRTRPVSKILKHRKSLGYCRLDAYALPSLFILCAYISSQRLGFSCCLRFCRHVDNNIVVSIITIIAEGRGWAGKYIRSQGKSYNSRPQNWLWRLRYLRTSCSRFSTPANSNVLPTQRTQHCATQVIHIPAAVPLLALLYRDTCFVVTIYDFEIGYDHSSLLLHSLQIATIKAG